MKRLLVGIDFGDTTEAVLDSARALSDELGCELLLCHAVEYVPKGYETDFAEEREIRRHFDERLAELAAANSATTIPATIGPAVKVLMKLAKKHKADAILTGVSNRSAMERFFLGSTAERLVRQSKWPVFLRHPEDEGGRVENIACAVDYSAHSKQTLRSAIALARALKAELKVIHVTPEPFTYPGLPDISVYHVSTPEPTAKAKQAMEDFLGHFDTSGLTVTPVLRSGVPSATIVTTCRDLKPDLLIIGKHGRGGIVDLLVGGVATDILRDVPCSMLVIGKRKLEA